MRVALMQPYFFPYLGYFSLMAAVDVFVVYDNVQYSRPGWINRNRLLRNGAPEWWTATVEDAPHQLDINQRRYQSWPQQRRRLLDHLRERYRRAANASVGMALVDAALTSDQDNVAHVNAALLTHLAKALGLQCDIRMASSMAQDTGLSGEARVLDLCKAFGGTTYVNSPGGMGLYAPSAFAKHGLELRFVEASPAAYPQFDAPFVPALSIVDALMFLPTVAVAERVAQFNVVELRT